MGDKYRALFLINHKTLRSFQIPIMKEMGFEVYCAKVFSYNEGNLSASVDYSYDKDLTIPKNVIEELNKVNFYEEIPTHIMGLLNMYFDVAFFGFFPEQLKMLVKGFKGVLILQPFGLVDGITYTDVIIEILGINFYKQLEGLKRRFIFGKSYKNIDENEADYFRNTSLYLPIGINNTVLHDAWEGGEHKIFFVCPRIKTSGYYYQIYEKFKKDFHDFDYLIGGAQPIAVNGDERVKGYIPNETYQHIMKKTDVMFYHSVNKCHIHYHPIEAIREGMPLIFMGGGQLDTLAKKKLPGSCKNIKEARAKIKRIMRGDKRFINRVKKSQVCLLEPFSTEFCRKYWMDALPMIRNKIEEARETKNRNIKLAVLLTAEYKGEVLDYCIRFIKCLKRGIIESNDNIDIVFGYIDHPDFLDTDCFVPIINEGVPIRAFTFQFVDHNYINNAVRCLGLDYDCAPGRYCILNDGANFFEDCDALLMVDDRAPEKFFSLKPLVVVVHDYIRRYVPQMFDEYADKNMLYLQRHANAVFVNSVPVYWDAVQYGGIKRENLRLLPNLIEYPEETKEEDIKNSRNYFIWSTNLAIHKNHIKAMKGLIKYYENGGRLKCIITGVDTEKFDPEADIINASPYLLQIRDLVKNSTVLLKHIEFAGNLPKKIYNKKLKNAAFVFHPGYGDNGNYTVIDAVMYGVPALCNDYPAMRYYDECMGLNIKFIDAFSVDAIAEELEKIERNRETYVRKLPQKEDLKRFTIECSYKKIYETVKEILGI